MGRYCSKETGSFIGIHYSRGFEIIEWNEGNSISIRMSNDSSSSFSNVVSNVNDNSLESYLIGEANKGIGDDEDLKIPSEINNCSILPPVNAIDGKNRQSTVVTTNGKANTGAGITTQSIDEILKGLKFKSPKRVKKGTKNKSLIDNDLL